MAENESSFMELPRRLRCGLSSHDLVAYWLIGHWSGPASSPANAGALRIGATLHFRGVLMALPEALILQRENMASRGEPTCHEAWHRLAIEGLPAGPVARSGDEVSCAPVLAQAVHETWARKARDRCFESTETQLLRPPRHLSVGRRTSSAPMQPLPN